MPIIKLWNAVGLGLIINHPTGIYISNQTGGTARWCERLARTQFNMDTSQSLAPAQKRFFNFAALRS